MAFTDSRVRLSGPWFRSNLEILRNWLPMPAFGALQILGLHFIEPDFSPVQPRHVTCTPRGHRRDYWNEFDILPTMPRISALRAGYSSWILELRLNCALPGDNFRTRH